MLASLAGLLAGCAGAPREADSLFGVITPYRFEIVQGNVVTREQIERLTTGMTRRQARERPRAAERDSQDRGGTLGACPAPARLPLPPPLPHDPPPRRPSPTSGAPR